MTQFLFGLLIVGLVWLAIASFIVGLVAGAERRHKAQQARAAQRTGRDA
ncbi:hypothetical protein [Arthrobacter sp. HY1533]|nr:hypothetical protein [Arthrobacter sp. HY1533]